MVAGAEAGLPDGPKARIQAGIDAYQADGAKAAVNSWTEGGGLEGDSTTLSYVSTLIQIESFFGKVVGASYYDSKDLGESVTIAYVIILYEKGPLYTTWQLYRTPSDKWVTSYFTFNTKISEIWPENLYLH